MRTKRLRGRKLEDYEALLVVLPRYASMNPFTDFHLDLIKAIDPMSVSQSDLDTIESLTWTYEGYLHG